MNRKKLAVATIGVVATIGLIGVGAGASFTDSASAKTSIQTGTVQLLLSADSGTPGKLVSFNAGGVSNGDATTYSHTIQAVNNGSLALHVTNVHVACDGPLTGVTSVSIGGAPIACNGDYAVSDPTVFPVPANGAAPQEAVVISVAANNVQGAQENIVITATAAA